MPARDSVATAVGAEGESSGALSREAPGPSHRRLQRRRRREGKRSTGCEGGERDRMSVGPEEAVRVWLREPPSLSRWRPAHQAGAPSLGWQWRCGAWIRTRAPRLGPTSAPRASRPATCDSTGYTHPLVSMIARECLRFTVTSCCRCRRPLGNFKFGIIAP